MEAVPSKMLELAKTEMLEAQKERNLLMRWKLILVSAIGAAALGFSRESPLPNTEFALCAIPFTCVYVDVLCRNLSIRTKMINRFLAQRQVDPLETFYQAYHEPRGSSLESLALRTSTILLSILVIPVGILAHSVDPSALTVTWFSWGTAPYYLAGLFGVIGSLLVESRYRAQTKALKTLTVSANASDSS